MSKIIQHLKISDVCDFVGGSQPPKSEFINELKEGYIRLVQTRDFKTDNFPTYIPENSTSKFFSEQDIMIGRYGPPIFQIFRGMTGAYNVALLKAKPKKNILNDYLYYFLKQQEVFEYVDKLSARTGGQTGVDLVSLYNYPITLPDLFTQSQIAKILSDLDAKTELNNKINAELEAMVKLIYDYWFVQFDFPNEDGLPYKSSGGKMVWSEELKRETPEGWEVKTIADLLISFSDKSIKIESKNILKKGGYPVITQDNGEFLAGYTNESNPIINVPLIVFGDHSCTLRYVDFPFFRGADGTQLMRFDDNFTIYMFLYIQRVIKQLPGYGKYERHFKYLKEFKVVVPNSKIKSMFNSEIKPIFEKISRSRFENQKLSELRDWLLPMLMNGQVKVG